MNTEELNFAYKVRHALNDISDQIPTSTAGRLAAARKLALQRRKKPGVLVWVPKMSMAGANAGGGLMSAPPSWMGKLGMLLMLVVLATGINGLVEHEHLRRVAEIAEMDAAVLSDELPLSAYTDAGFHAYLAKQRVD